LRQHQENAERIATYLDQHEAVRKVYYPGLEQHAGHALAARQQQGFGAMLSFELHGDIPEIEAFVDGLHYFSLAESLGGVESLVAHPASMTHAAMAPEARRAAGIADTLLRLSIGIEDGDDLLHDLEAGLQRAQAVIENASKRRVIA
jgi:cystathionine gamma-synthase